MRVFVFLKGTNAFNHGTAYNPITGDQTFPG